MATLFDPGGFGCRDSRPPRGARRRSCSRGCAWCPRGAPERSMSHTRRCFGFPMPRAARVRSPFTDDASRCNTVAPAPRHRPPCLAALPRDNHLITPAGGDERPGETSGRNRPLWPSRWTRPVMPGGGFETRLIRGPAPRVLRKPSPKPRRRRASARKRRRGVSAASRMNRGAGRVCNRRRNSGGRIRTYDLRVMSPTSYQAALPRIGLA